MVTSVTERIPDPHDFKDPNDQKATESALLMFKFEIAPSRKEVLLKGLDDIGTSMQHSVAIDAYEKSHIATATMYDPIDVKYYSHGGR